MMVTTVSRKFVLRCMFFGALVASVTGDLYHVDVPALSDPASRNLAYSCAYGRGTYECIFDASIRGPSGGSTDIELAFNCLWDYKIGIDVRDSNCLCAATINPGTSGRMCSCAGCPRDGGGGFGVSIDCRGRHSTMTIVDDCRAIDCSAQCHSEQGVQVISGGEEDENGEEEEEEDVDAVAASPNEDNVDGSSKGELAEGDEEETSLNQEEEEEDADEGEAANNAKEDAAIEESPPTVEVCGDVIIDGSTTITAWNTFQDAVDTSGAEMIWDQEGPTAMSARVEFSRFPSNPPNRNSEDGFYDIDFTTSSITYTLRDNSAGSHLVFPDGTFDRYYFDMGRVVTSAEIVADQTTIASRVRILPPGFSTTLIDPFNTGVEMPEFVNGGLVIEVVPGADITELGQRIVVCYSLGESVVQETIPEEGDDEEDEPAAEEGDDDEEQQPEEDDDEEEENPEEGDDEEEENPEEDDDEEEEALAVNPKPADVAVCGDASIDSSVSITAWNTFQDAVDTSGAEMIWDEEGPTAMNAGIEFSLFPSNPPDRNSEFGFYDIDFTSTSITYTLRDNSAGSHLVFPDGSFDRYYFNLGKAVTFAEIVTDQTTITSRVEILPPGFITTLIDPFNTGINMPEFVDGGLLIEVGPGANITELGQHIVVCYSLAAESSKEQIAASLGVDESVLDDTLEDDNDNLDGETLAALADAIAVITSQTDVTGQDLFEAINEGITTVETVINVADGITDGTTNPEDFNAFIEAVRLVEDSGVDIDVIMQRLQDGNITREEIVEFADAIVVIEATTNVTAEEMIDALADGIVRREKFVEIAANIRAGTFEIGKLEEFIDSVRLIEKGGVLSFEEIRDRLSEGDFNATLIIQLATAIVIITDETDVKAEDIVQGLVDGWIAVPQIAGLADDIEGGEIDAFEFQRLVDAIEVLADDLDEEFLRIWNELFQGELTSERTIEAVDALVIIEKETDLDGSDVAEAMLDEVIDRDELLDMVDALDDGSLSACVFEMVIKEIIELDDAEDVQSAYEELDEKTHLTDNMICTALINESLTIDELFDLVGQLLFGNLTPEEIDAFLD